MHSMMETEDWYVLTYVSIYYILTRYMNGSHVTVGQGSFHRRHALSY